MEPQIDFTKIEFPTDKLTIKMVRSNYPWAFDRPAALSENRTHFYGRASIENALGGLVDCERRLAVVEFKRVLNLPLTTEEGKIARASLAETLVDEYVHLGLASGDHHAEQLIRGLEAQVSAQAQSHTGRRSP
jgi:hypothetical protein